MLWPWPCSSVLMPSWLQMRTKYFSVHPQWLWFFFSPPPHTLLATHLMEKITSTWKAAQAEKSNHRIPDMDVIHDWQGQDTLKCVQLEINHFLLKTGLSNHLLNCLIWIHYYFLKNECRIHGYEINWKKLKESSNMAFECSQFLNVLQHNYNIFILNKKIHV